MPDDSFPETAAGWPYIEPSNWLYKTPEYTELLAAKLDAGDADVAAAINAANEAQAAAAAFAGVRIYGGRTTVSSTTPVTYTQTTVTLPDGRFTDASRMFAVATGTTYQHTYTVRTIVNSPTSISVGARHVDLVSQEFTLDVDFIVVQTPA